ncbi:hypothetical protein TNIN_444211 [Trichonephila inaurata madagascariensis]|uniref:Uncharacterized protein n=1 Tax=Trichonephila inaurata madagascariensis TaxID=2747483 RepID=A0A8X7CB15_9ARAC|nr:hypothetical protein TNIN_444211 [Trichonephila inaurata madagascariensis]
MKKLSSSYSWIAYEYLLDFVHMKNDSRRVFGYMQQKTSETTEFGKCLVKFKAEGASKLECQVNWNHHEVVKNWMQLNEKENRIVILWKITQDLNQLSSQRP